MLTGRAARGSTWRVLDAWVGEWSTTDAATPAAKKAKSVAKKAAAKKAVAKKKPAARKSPAKPTTDAESIGVNPTRRYGSAGSRGLAR
jgi:polyhydroxyalkanoate synthase